MRIGVHRIAMSNPADVSGLRALVDSGEIDPAAIVAGIGKTEGNGGANDFTRALATNSFAEYLGRVLDQPSGAITERIAFVWSGGCEGVLSPHVTLFTRHDEAAEGGEPRLALSVQRTRDFLPEEVGRLPEVDEVAAAVRRGLDDLAVKGSDVHYVQVKGPLLTPAGLADARARGAEVVTEDPNRSKAYARGATALGVALGLGQIHPDALTQDAIARDMALYSDVASTSAGGELTSCEILLFANSSSATGDYRIGHGVLEDAIDLRGVKSALRNAGLTFDCEPEPLQQDRIAAVFAKAEAPVAGVLRGSRTTMLSDADINYERHARAAVGAVIASMTGDPRIFVSGGTEHQCAPGAAPIAAIVRA